jgi:hypothetical protein
MKKVIMFSKKGGYGEELFDLDSATLTDATKAGETVVLSSCPHNTIFVLLPIGTVEATKTYKVSFTVSSRTEGGIYVLRPYDYLAGKADANGDFSYELVGDLGYGLMLRASGTTSLTVSNISVKEVL